MANPSDEKSFLKMVTGEFGEVLVHHLVFENKDSGSLVFLIIVLY